MQFTRMALIVAAAAAFSVQAAQATQTVASFADPALNSSTPLFSFDGSFLTGGWSGSNLDLQTPFQFAGSHYPTSTFTMTPLAVTSFNGAYYTLGAGHVDFFDSSSNPLLTVSFTSATLYGTLHQGFGFNGSDFWGQGVTFSGPILNGYTVSNRLFGFTFANENPTGSGYTSTAAFTSSADLIAPAPGAAALLGLGGLVATRRRR